MLNLYLVTRIDSCGYDEYDSFIVSAHSAHEAKHTHPGEGGIGKWDGFSGNCSSWTLLKNVKCKEIGTYKGKKKTVILSSFNAG